MYLGGKHLPGSLGAAGGFLLVFGWSAGVSCWFLGGLLVVSSWSSDCRVPPGRSGRSSHSRCGAPPLFGDQLCWHSRCDYDYYGTHH